MSCLLFHPDIEAAGGGKGYLKEFPGPDVLTQFDVIFLGDVGLGPNQLKPEECDALKLQVANQASGLVLLPGFRGNQNHAFDHAIGRSFSRGHGRGAQPRGWGSAAPGQFELTDLGLRSLLTRLADTDTRKSECVGESARVFTWFAGVSRAKAGTEVLATHSSESNRYGRIPLIVTKTFGTGKILFMGTDGAWRWRKGVEDKYHYRFWGQVARWMAYQRNHGQRRDHAPVLLAGSTAVRRCPDPECKRVECRRRAIARCQRGRAGNRAFGKKWSHCACSPAAKNSGAFSREPSLRPSPANTKSR